MAIMKQIDESLTRLVQKKKPLKKKWRSCLNGGRPTPTLLLFHYNHLILEFDLKDKTILYQWWEKAADKRGLDSAIEWLEKNNEVINNFTSSFPLMKKGIADFI
ncbi:hypothetical protein P4478_00205 [Bacillus subtilis]|nr:hypothetical protein [Bacillus subtilis]